MPERIFLQILNMSFAAGFAIVFVLIARLLLKRAPKILSYALWGVVLFRLLCPFSFESVLSLMPIKANPIPREIVYTAVPTIDTGIPAINHAVNSSLPAATPEASINPLQIWTSIGTLVWLLGIAILLAYSIISLVKLQKRLKNAVHEKDNIYLAQHLETPFVMGIMQPKIYLPASLTAEEKNHILLHEKMHIKRLDHLIKLVSFIALCLHWFNPLVWIAFLVSGRDMEMSCDEAVIRQLGSSAKKSYSTSLLALATGRRIIGGTPLAFGEGDTKGRIKNVLNYRKPAFWVLVIAVIAVLVLIIGLSSNPLNTPLVLPEKSEVSRILIEQVDGGESLGVVQITDAADIGTIMNALQDTNKTLRKSVNDVPNSKDYIWLRIEGPTLQRLFLFAEGNKYYIEESYSGIYKTTREAASSITEVYISNGGADLEGTIADLWKARTKYVGDNSSVGKIIGLLMAYDSFELQTNEEPYSITINLKTDTETRNYLSDTSDTARQAPFIKNAIIMFSLIENVELIKFVFDDGINPSVYQLADGIAATYLGEEYFSRTETLEGFRLVLQEVSEKVPVGADIERPAQQGGLTFFVKPDEPPQVIGEAAAHIWLKSYMKENTPNSRRVEDYSINELAVISVTPSAGQNREEMDYHYIVRMNYDITTASDEYFSRGDSISGKGVFAGLFRKLYIKDLDGANFDIIGADSDDEATAVIMRQRMEIN